MKSPFPLGAARRVSYRAVLFSGWLVMTSIGAFASGGAKTTPTPASTPRPVARLVSTTSARERRPAPVQPRARLVTATRVATIGPAHASAAPAAVAVLASSEEQRVFDLVNEERRARGEKPLVWDGELCRLARVHAQEMARHGFIAHTGRDGRDTAERAAAMGIRGWQALGENIAYNQGFDDPAAFAVERWMLSNKHRENILNGYFTHSGLGVAKGPDGRVYFTQVFVSR